MVASGLLSRVVDNLAARELLLRSWHLDREVIGNISRRDIVCYFYLIRRSEDQKIRRDRRGTGKRREKRKKKKENKNSEKPTGRCGSFPFPFA